MEIVDGIEIHILGVPGKGSLPHAEVEVSCVDSWYRHPILVYQSVQDSVEVVDVPLLDRLVREAARNVGSVEGLVECHIFPVLPF